MTDLRELLHAAAPRPPEFNLGEITERSDPAPRTRLRPFVAGLGVVAVVVAVATVASNRNDGESGPAAQPPGAPLGIAHGERLASSQVDGVSWTVFRGQGGTQHVTDVCYRYETTPPVSPERAPDGTAVFPGFCAQPSVAATANTNDALLAKIVPLPNGATLVYGPVRGGIASLALTYSDGTTATYSVIKSSIALAVPSGKTLDKIAGTFNNVAVECTPMPPGGQSPRAADSRAPDGEYGCIAAPASFTTVPHTSGP